MMSARIKDQSPRRHRILALTAAVTVALGVTIATILLLSSSSSPSASDGPVFADSRYPNVDVSNTRHAISSIEGSTVSGLVMDWTLPITAQASFYGSYFASPVVADGVVYSQDQASNVQAIDLESGDVLWEKSYEAPIEGPNGVVVANGRVYGATQADAFGLDAKTGKELWSTTLLGDRSEQISMAPGYRDGTVYVSTSPAPPFDGGEAGVLWALDGKTGKKKWSFETVPDDLWGNPDINFGGGLTHTPAFDDRGSMYFSVGIPGPIPGTKRYPWGSSRPGPNLYTNSVVKLDAETGRLRWFHQLTPHGLCNWTLGPPVLLKTGKRDLVIVGGRSGMVTALDRQSGRLVWRRPVGLHNGHDEDGLIAMRGEYSRLKLPMTVFPGRFGGVAAQLSANESTIFVPVVNLATRLVGQQNGNDVPPASGELVALDAATGATKWKQRLPSPPYGATTVTNDLLFATSVDGALYAFDNSSGEQVWKTRLPAGIDAGITISGDTLLAAAGYALGRQAPKLLAYRLSN
jgi:outer membrane protein assembly factor BamB